MPDKRDTPLLRAARQATDSHAVLTSLELGRCGFSRDMISNATRRGALFATPFTGVFSVGTPIRTPFQRAMAAQRATLGLISHHWCRWLFGVGRLPRHDPDVLATNRRERDGLTLHRTRALPQADANHGIPCTRPERMVIDCAPDLSDKDLRRLVNDVQIKRLTSFHSLRAAVVQSPGRDTRALRSLLSVEPRGATRSLLEDLLDDLSAQRGLPAPQINAMVDGYEVDFSYHDGAIILEADGYESHGTKIAFERDREKWLALEANGRRVIVVSYRQVTELRERTAHELDRIIRVPAPISISASPSSAITTGDPPVYGSVSAPVATG